MSKWWFIVIVFAGFINWYTEGGITSSIYSAGSRSYNDVIADIAPLHEEAVILYATQWCGYCKKTREFLHSKGIAYIEYDIETSDVGRQQYERLNGRGVPLLLIKSDIVRGYNIQAINTALEKL